METRIKSKTRPIPHLSIEATGKSSKRSINSFKDVLHGLSSLKSFAERKPVTPRRFGSLPVLKEATLSTNAPRSLTRILASCQPDTLQSSRELRDSIQLLQTIGKGSGGIVYLGCYSKRLKLVAAKEITLENREEKDLVKSELEIMQQTKAPISPKQSGKFLDRRSSRSFATVCPYIVAFYGAYREPESPVVTIFMEYMNAGSLQDLIAQRKQLPDEVLRYIAFSVLQALAYMHRNFVLHRDIKPGNILLSRDGTCKVADMGLATQLQTTRSFIADFKGTVKYMAPERLTGNKSYSFKSDIWSVGLILITLIKRKYPFDTDDGFFGLEHDILHKELPEMREVAPDLQSLIEWMLERDPIDRCSALEALNHVSIRNYDREIQNPHFLPAWEKVCSPKTSFGEAEVYNIAQQVVEGSRHFQVAWTHDQKSETMIEEEEMDDEEIELAQKMTGSKRKGLKRVIKAFKASKSKYRRSELEKFATDLGVPLRVAKQAFENGLKTVRCKPKHDFSKLQKRHSASRILP